MLPLLFALVPATFIASPSPSPPPSSLKTIVTVKSSVMCGEFAAHTNAAIAAAVVNDRSLGTLILVLRSDDLAGSEIARSGEIHQLDGLAAAIYQQYRTGEAEVNQIRAVAARVPDPQEKAALKSSADALGGALYRQHLIQRDLDGFIAYLNAGDMRRSVHDDNDDAMRAGLVTDSISNFSPVGQVAGSETRGDDVNLAQQASDDFQSRMPALLQDEMTAAGRIETAAEGC
jgi:hypothetical protein